MLFQLNIYFVRHLISSADPANDLLLRRLVRYNCIGTEEHTLCPELYIEEVIRDQKVLEKMKEKARDHANLSAAEVDGLKFVYKELKNKYYNQENDELCTYFEDCVPDYKLI